MSARLFIFQLSRPPGDVHRDEVESYVVVAHDAEDARSIIAEHADRAYECPGDEGLAVWMTSAIVEQWGVPSELYAARGILARYFIPG